MDTIKNDDNNDLVTEEKKRKLRGRVYLLIKENNKTKSKHDNLMVDEIIKIITREVENDN